MAETSGNSNRITREYIDSLLIETRYLDAVTPKLDFELYGAHFASPVMTAALSHLDHFMFPGAEMALARGAAEANAVLWYGMAEEEAIERMAATGARMIEIIKPYTDRGLIYRKIAHAEKIGLLAVGIDIDHAFGPDGSADVVSGHRMSALTTAELGAICRSTKLPVIVKGVLSLYDAEHALNAGARGLLLSHHNNRVEYAVPPLALLPAVAALAERRVPLFVDGEMRTGMDAFKALALGATGVGFGRSLMNAIKNDPQNGVRDAIRKANGELAKAMASTGCRDLQHIDPGIIHHR